MAATRRAADPPESISVLVAGRADWRDDVVATVREDGELLATTATQGRDGYEWLATQPGEVDCVVCPDDLPDMTGVRFVETVRAVAPDVPVVLVAGDGSEDLARRAIAADVTEYVVDDGRTSLAADVARHVRQAAADYRATRTRRRRARQFDAVFDDPGTFTWVVAPDGRLRRANRTAVAHVDAARADLVEEPFAATPWWGPSTRDDVRTALRTAVDGEVTRFETELADEGPTLDLSFRPVRGPDGTVASVVVEGVDVTERADLERELRESEELHRVTLNNMTDTVLVTDDDGEFTYICPNVHFIFGYSVEEIEELGSIDALLGEDLYDPERLESEGVLTNVECTATDKAGREHTLLVNVRQVSIQGGTTLYSCRDITKRKERERALTALHGTSRELLYAETEREIADRVIEDAADVLDVDGAAIYLFDRDRNELWPAASTDSLASLYGPLPRFGLDETSLTARTFVEQETSAVDDVRTVEAFRGPAADVRSAMFIPLADHGVFVAVARERGAFDDVTREVVDLLAATVEAGLDRVEREEELREQERTLQDRNRQLTRLNRTNEIIREIDQALVTADSREAIERAVCDRLTASDRFAFAWVGEVSPGASTLQPRAWAGADRGYLDGVDLGLDDPATPAAKTAESETVTAVDNVADDPQVAPWRTAALSHGYQSVISVPLTHDGVTYGTLSVYADRADEFDERARTVLGELGVTIASAIRSVERKQALFSDTVTELDYRITDSNCVLYALARRTDCSVDLQGGLRQADDGVRVLVAVDRDPATVVSAADDLVGVASARALSTVGDGGVVQLTLTRPFLATKLADHGATLTSLTADPDAATATVRVPNPVETHTVDDVVSTALADSELVAQRERDRQVATARQFRSRFLDDVTERQLEVVQTAYYSGYFEAPRANSGEDVAAALDISPAAFYDHLRKVQRTLFETLFETAVGTTGRFNN
ncbi:bacterio-opsin activator domain-containing protein [Halomicrococcus gelatinilyticus]|uniref:bacterio-opsin activator domain-containing protein n=1 Tax=Halomicrococcus gelatinilyticus TaxID=1702103 RepID=UPI002E0E4A83